MLIQGEKIIATAKTPEIILNQEGIIRIKGRWMMENNTTFSRVVSDWYDKHIFDQPEISAIDIYLEYFSGVNIFILISLLRRILCVNLMHRELPINWYYSAGDEDILDLGKYISSVLGKSFNFMMVSENKFPVGFTQLQVQGK